MDVRAKLAEIGLTLPVAALPVAAYVPSVRTGNLVFTAGQLPLVDGLMADTGKVGGTVSAERAKELATICILNALAAVELVAPVDSIVRVVQVRGFVNGVDGFIGHPGVVNGASETLIHIWGDVNGKHARTAIGVAELPLDAPVEIELVVEVA